MNDEAEEARIDGLSDYGLKEVIEKNTYPKWRKYASEVLSKRQMEEKVFTRTQAYVLVVSTVIIAVCAVLTLVIQLSGN